MYKTRLVFIGGFTLAAAAWSATAMGVGEYGHGHGALEIFDGDGFAVTPLWVKVWVSFMVLTFAVGLYFAWKHPLARWEPGGFIVSAASGEVVFSALGLPFLGGSVAIMHLVCWTPALVLLIMKRPFLDQDEPRGFRVWSGTMTSVILFSFVFDVQDAAAYIIHISAMS